MGGLLGQTAGAVALGLLQQELGVSEREEPLTALGGVAGSGHLCNIALHWGVTYEAISKVEWKGLAALGAEAVHFCTLNGELAVGQRSRS